LAAVVFCGVFDLRNIAGAKRPGLVKKMQKVFEIVAIQSRKATRENRRQIVQRDKRQRRTVKYIDLAIERLTTGACTAELANGII